ncbi:hypothetical protein CH341_15820 [Rhodoplanes roseus]|uniref:Uncharacterized protein n=1 Tax=Rhodoplanes roseus TaxID=29409 RepID=A0A327L0W8_9BRAD|nr:hypothetical protein CH341_15820 [Rhodoplanes roseus]
MRADQAAAYLDYETTGQLYAAVSRGEAPRPTASRLRDGRRENVWALESLRRHVANRHEISSDVDIPRESIGSLI